MAERKPDPAAAVPAAPLETLIERACRFNCDAESSCNCYPHQMYRTALALLAPALAAGAGDPGSIRALIDGVSLIAAERQRQVTREGWTPGDAAHGVAGSRRAGGRRRAGPAAGQSRRRVAVLDSTLMLTL